MTPIEIRFPKKNEDRSKDLLKNSNAGVKTTVGTVFLEKGTRIPEKGFSKHPFNEVSLVIEGSIEMLNEKEEVIGILKPGMAVFVSAGEPQAGNVLENTKIIYILNEKIRNI
tara:strand:+ start:739 stop:1074 length:336 start_codon:yes stop_codon:yes gene_type:complete